MSWFDLGTLTLNYDWQQYTLPVINSGVFRVTQNFPNYPPNGKLVLAQQFNSTVLSYVNIKAFHRYKDPYVFTWEVPQLLIDEGIIIYYPVAKLTKRARLDPNNAWTAKLEILNP